MTKDDIIKWLNLGQTGTLCIFRDKVNEDFDLILKSLSIVLSLKTGYELQVDFDAINQAEQGEGWQWCTSSTSLEKLIPVLEGELKTPLSDWTYVKKTGMACIDDEKIDWDKLSKQGLLFEEKHDYGHEFLPGLPDDIYWSRRPYSYDKKHNLAQWLYK
ncbi:hypothetical protein [Serratia sp. 2723]|uniref:hypothetical protein n=1 Tax=unclassified Serratia (in: enterobacteria) TaxID=2647522 RepID=UPI003D2609DF